MSRKKPLIAVVDDEEDILKTVKTVLKPLYDVVTFSDPGQALKKIPGLNADIVLLDIRMPDIDGITLLQKLKESDPGPEAVMVTALSDSKTAVRAMKAGAYDYISKPFDSEEIKLVIERALEKIRLQKENLAYKEMSRGSSEEMVGRSRQMKAVFEMIARVAKADSTVLITGETGSGKEMVARSVHLSSLRSARPFITVNCAAIPENLFESELFGHERGAFTGALERHPGKFELADGGSIFLDEIGCLPYPMQAKLLRVIQESEVQRVGGEKPFKVDVRLICATNADLKTMSQKGAFREDLYYRLNVIPVKVPALRERPDDIPLLLDHFLEKFNKKLNRKIKGFDDRALDILKIYGWPGNVRELENMVERAVVLSQNDIIRTEDLPQDMTACGKGEAGQELARSLDDFEKDQIKKALIATRGNKSLAAKSLKIDRTTLLSKIRKFNIN